VSCGVIIILALWLHCPLMKFLKLLHLYQILHLLLGRGQMLHDVVDFYLFCLDVGLLRALSEASVDLVINILSWSINT
jgi:hypothetical protein